MPDLTTKSYAELRQMQELGSHDANREIARRKGVQEITREQEAAIARLAIDNPTVGVSPQADGTVITEAGGKRLVLDADGNATPEPVERAYLALPIDLLRRMLGDDVMDAALEDVAGSAYPDHALATKVGDDVRARILELLATSESVREAALHG